MPFTSQVTVSSVVLATVAVKVWPSPAGTLPDPGHTATCTAGAAAEHDLAVAPVGAVDTAEVGLRTTFAVSTRPASSVTATCTVAKPHDGAVTVAAALVSFRIATACFPMPVHWYVLMV